MPQTDKAIDWDKISQSSPKGFAKWGLSFINEEEDTQQIIDICEYHLLTGLIGHLLLFFDSRGIYLNTKPFFADVERKQVSYSMYIVASDFYAGHRDFPTRSDAWIAAIGQAFAILETQSNTQQ